MKQRMNFFEERFLCPAILLGLLMISFESPTWIAVFALLLVVLRFFFEKWERGTWNSWVSNVIALLLALETYVRVGSFISEEATVGLVLGLTALKIFDYAAERDRKFLILLGFVIYSLKPLFTLDIQWLPLTLVGFFLLLTAMLLKAVQSPVKITAQLVLVSLPLAIVLFFIFPRFASPWVGNFDDRRARVGFSESFKPGQVAELIQQADKVFTVRFLDEAVVERQQLYWRGVVHHHSAGLEWSQFPPRKSAEIQTQTLVPAGAIEYEVVMEPSEQQNLFLLEHFAGIEARHSLKSSGFGVYRLAEQAEKRVLYRAKANLLHESRTAPEQDDLQIPVLGEKTKELIAKLLKSQDDMSEKIAALNTFFREGQFVYTIEPGAYEENGFETLLFDRKQGFCEHFAGAYATLARAMGIPARVIGGFVGGEYNRFGRFWVVSTQNAHAWVEVFDGEKWVRVDPTEFVAAGQQFLFSAQALATNKSGFVATLFSSLGDYLQSLNYRWIRFLVEFDGTDWQGPAQRAVWLGLSLVGFLLLQLVLKNGFFLRMSQVPKTASQKKFLQIEKKFAKLGLSRIKDEPPLSYLERLLSQSLSPKLTDELRSLQANYREENYRSTSPGPRFLGG